MNNSPHNNIPERVKFTCSGCGKTIRVQENIYQQAYKDKEQAEQIIQDILQENGLDWNEEERT